MQSFTHLINPMYKKSFNIYYINRQKEKLRSQIYDHIISHTENEYFSLDEFIAESRDRNLANTIINDIMQELRNIGWKCTTSFGGTGLFIYSSEKPPSNCFEDSKEFM
jgi:hypothetical protein